jgi:hypothetical protein
MQEACARIRHLGYAAANRVRIYGEKFVSAGSWYRNSS